MEVNNVGDNILISASKEESEVIKEALVCFFNSKPEKFMSDEQKDKRKIDNKIALALHSSFPEPEIIYTH
jgi:hypothetical protein